MNIWDELDNALCEWADNWQWPPQPPQPMWIVLGIAFAPLALMFICASATAAYDVMQAFIHLVEVMP